MLPYALRQQAAIQNWADSNAFIANAFDEPLGELFLPRHQAFIRAENALEECKIRLVATGLDTVFEIAEAYADTRLPSELPAAAARAIAQSQADSMNAWMALELHDRTSSASIAHRHLRDEKLAEIVRDYVADLCAAAYAAPSAVMLARAKQHALLLLAPSTTIDYPEQGELDSPFGLDANSGISQSHWRLDAAAALACAERQLAIPRGYLDGGFLQYAPGGRAFAVKIEPHGRALLRDWALSPAVEAADTAAEVDI